MSEPMRPPTPDELATHFDRKKRRAMVRMAQACGLDPKRWGEIASVRTDLYDLEDPSARLACWDQIAVGLPPESMLRLWNQVSEAIAGGVPQTSAHVADDPFAVFLTGICQYDHEGRGHHRQTAVVKTGELVDQAEGEKILLYLKSQDAVNTCEVCGEKITTWQADNTRISPFRTQEMAGTQMATVIRGSDV